VEAAGHPEIMNVEFDTEFILTYNNYYVGNIVVHILLHNLSYSLAAAFHIAVTSS